MVLVTTEDQAMIDRIPHQVNAGSHDKRDDADVDHGPGEGLRGPLNELQRKKHSRSVPGLTSHKAEPGPQLREQTQHSTSLLYLLCNRTDDRGREDDWA